MSYQEVLKDIKKNKIAPIYFLYGTEAYFIEDIKDNLIKKITNKDPDSLSIYDLEETPIEDVIVDVETYPFFSEQKIVIAHNPIFLKTKPDKLAFEHNTAVLESYLTAPVDYSTLILIAPYEKVDERKKITKLLKKEATTAVCNPLKDYDLRQWITKLVNKLNITISPGALEILEAESTTNLHQLENEINKLALYVGDQREITKEIAEDLVSHTTNNSSLRLVDAIMEKDLKKAIKIYKDLEKMKEEPIAMIGLIAFQFRSILRIKLLKEQGYSQFQIQKQMGVHPYVVKIGLNRERNFTKQRLEQIMNGLANADATMKSGRMEKNLAFELLLYELIKK